MAVMGNMANSSSRCAYALLILLPVTANAGDWAFTPSISVNERFSDNVALSSVNPESSFLTEVKPGFNLRKQGGKGTVSVDYSLQGLFYTHDSSANDFNNQLAALLKTELDYGFFLDADARIAQQNTSLTAASGTGNYNTTGNRSETRSASVTPSWRGRFGNDAKLDARWQLNYADSNDGSISGTSGNSLSVNLSSGESFARVPWGVSYRLQSNNGSASADRNSSLSGNAGYVFSPKTRLTLTLGKDNNNGNSAGFNQASGTFWNLGLNWTPSNRTTLAVNAGHRYGGNSYGLNFMHRTRKTTWALKYSEDITDAFSQITSTGAFDIYQCGSSLAVVPAGSGSPDVAQCGVLPLYPALLRNSTQLVNDTTLNKAWSGSATYQAGKSTFSLSVNKVSRVMLTAGTSDDNYSLGGSWAFRLSPRVTSSLNMGMTHAKATGSQSDDWNLAWTLSRQLARQTTGAVELRRVQRDSGSTAGAYKENSVSARVNMSF